MEAANCRSLEKPRTEDTEHTEFVNSPDSVVSVASLAMSVFTRAR